MMELIKIKICGEKYKAVQITHTYKTKSYNRKHQREEKITTVRKFLVPDEAIENLEWQGTFSFIEVDGQLIEVYMGGVNCLIEKEVTECRV